MNFFERKRRMDHLLEMIEKGRCVSLEQVATKFECSERTVKRLLSNLREEGLNIKYCKAMKKFQKVI